MKKAICWAVCRKPYHAGLRVIAVTTRKPNGRVYGRDDTGHATNVAARDVRGFYATEADARAVVKRAEEAHASYRERIEEAEGWVQSLRREQDRAVTLALAPGRIP